MRIDTGTITPAVETLVELLRRQAHRYGDKIVFAYSETGTEEGRVELSYLELDRKARAVATSLQAAGATGRRVLVFCREGLEQIAGIFGCWYAGAIAVPVHETLPPRLSWVIADAQPAFAVTSRELPMRLKAGVDAVVQLGGEPPLVWVLTDRGDAHKWIPPEISGDTVAMLMYTSGTTASPKAIVVTHRNIVCNVAQMARVSGDNDQTVGVSWMPHQHNMSVVSGIVAVVNAGSTGYGVLHHVLDDRPIRFLEAVAELRATAISTAYWACNVIVERSTPSERAALDLSRLINVGGGGAAFSAAEMRRFVDAFAVAGLRPEAFRTGYGLTEATSGVSGSMVSTVPTVIALDRIALAEGRLIDVEPGDPNAVEVLSSGLVMAGQVVVIVDPETRLECRAYQVGEVWVAGPNVAQGYWRRPEETRETFGGFLADSGEGPFLRTGDLGFLRDGELFLVGRCKDLVWIGGSRYYPDEIEATVQAVHPALRSGRGAAFTVTPQLNDTVLPVELAVTQEVDPVDEADFGGIVDAVRVAVNARYGIDVGAVLLVAAGGLPSTSLGKIQRDQCRQLFTKHGLTTLTEWYATRQLPEAADSASKALLFSDLTVARGRRERETSRGAGE